MGGCQIHFTVSSIPPPRSAGSRAGALALGQAPVPRARGRGFCISAAQSLSCAAGPAQPPDQSREVPVALLTMGGPSSLPPPPGGH